MRVLIVGAGAVGQTYAHFLVKSGCEVGFLVKEAYADQTRQGTHVYCVNDTEPQRSNSLLVPTEVLTEPSSVGNNWDQVWICVASPALDTGNWLKTMFSSCTQTPVISFTPGPTDRSLLLKHVAKERLATGLITFLAWKNPLPGQTAEIDGIAFWCPSMVPNQFDGPADIVNPAIERLRIGGLAARRSQRLTRQAAKGASVLLCIIAALETAQWSFKEFGQSKAISMGCQAAQQALMITAREHDAHSRLLSTFIRPSLMRLFLTIAPRLTPMELEPYIAYHFSKVGSQTRAALQSWIKLGKQHNLPISALSELSDALNILHKYD